MKKKKKKVIKGWIEVEDNKPVIGRWKMISVYKRRMDILVFTNAEKHEVSKAKITIEL